MRNAISRLALLLAIALPVTATVTVPRWPDPPTGKIDALMISMSIEPASTLPGMPVSFRYVVKNKSDKPVRIPSYLAFRVVPRNGAAFIAQGPVTRVQQLPLDRTAEVVPARGEVEFGYSTFLRSGPPSFFDARLNVPGAYRVETLFTDDAFLAERAPVETIDLSSPAVRVVSSPVLLEVRIPKGADAAVWEKVLAAGQKKHGTEGLSYALIGQILLSMADEIWTHHRESAYAPFVAGHFIGSPEKQIELVTAALQHPAAEHDDGTLRYMLALARARLADDLVYRSPDKLDIALQRNAEARRDFEALLSGADDAQAREAIEERMRELSSPEMLRERAAANVALRKSRSPGQ